MSGDVLLVRERVGRADDAASEAVGLLRCGQRDAAAALMAEAIGWLELALKKITEVP